jgi:hypothetical protein
MRGIRSGLRRQRCAHLSHPADIQQWHRQHQPGLVAGGRRPHDPAVLSRRDADPALRHDRAGAGDLGQRPAPAEGALDDLALVRRRSGEDHHPPTAGRVAVLRGGGDRLVSVPSALPGTGFEPRANIPGHDDGQGCGRQPLVCIVPRLDRKEAHPGCDEKQGTSKLGARIQGTGAARPTPVTEWSRSGIPGRPGRYGLTAPSRRTCLRARRWRGRSLPSCLRRFSRAEPGRHQLHAALPYEPC